MKFYDVVFPTYDLMLYSQSFSFLEHCKFQIFTVVLKFNFKLWVKFEISAPLSR